LKGVVNKKDGDKMKYMGSKNRIAKEILPIILKERKDGQFYIEPFCGGCNMIDKVEGKRIASDQNHYLIELLKKLQEGWIPPKGISEEQFEDMKKNPKHYTDHLIGYVGFQLSFGAMWFSSYRKDKIGKRNYSVEAFNNVMKQAPKLLGIKFICSPYEDLEYPENSIIYCDPPYEDTIKYNAVGSFDHHKFWCWCREMSKKGHTVFISEYNAPEDFECIWEKKLQNGLGKSKNTEKLFKYSQNKANTEKKK